MNVYNHLPSIPEKYSHYQGTTQGQGRAINCLVAKRTQNNFAKKGFIYFLN